MSVIVPWLRHSKHFKGGSLTRPRLTTTISGEAPQVKHLKYAPFNSGMTAEHRVTMPLTATILSISDGFKSLIACFSSKLNGLTSKLGKICFLKFDLHLTSMTLIRSKSSFQKRKFCSNRLTAEFKTKLVGREPKNQAPKTPRFSLVFYLKPKTWSPQRWTWLSFTISSMTAILTRWSKRIQRPKTNSVPSSNA